MEAFTDSPCVAVRWTIDGSAPLPLHEAVWFGDLARRAAMRCAETTLGHVPAVLSGHDRDGTPAKAHAFFLPEDLDGDGRIDHLVVHAADGLSGPVLRALTAVARLYDGPAGAWRVVENQALGAGEGMGTVFGRAHCWVSVTPYVHPIHYKKRPDTGAHWQKVCPRAGLPVPERSRRLAETPALPARPPDTFRWYRHADETAPPDCHGSFWHLTFPEPVTGPVALGFNRHYGLGLFRPVPPDGGLPRG